MKPQSWLLALVLILLALGALSLWRAGARPAPPAATTVAATALYFSSPEQAVEVADALGRAGDWPQLARYYDLTGSALPRSSLVDGTYFQPAGTGTELADPMRRLTGRQPFPPGSVLDRVEPTADPAVVSLKLVLVIDQGGGLRQKARTDCLLRRSAAGWQLLPRPE